jgi:hypothetical protein
MAQVANVRKVFQFILEIQGVDQYEVQEVDLPELEVEAVEHGDANFSVKTPGRLKVGDIVLKKLSALMGSDTWAFDELMLAQNPYSGGGILPSQLKTQMRLKEVDTTQQVVVNVWIFDEAWVHKIKPTSKNRMSSDNLLEEITIKVDRAWKS